MSVDFKDLRRLDIVAVANWLGLNLRREPTTYRCCCPLCHSKDRRSFVISPRIGIWRCLRCEATGDCLELTSRLMRVSKPKAAEWLLEKFGRP